MFVCLSLNKIQNFQNLKKGIISVNKLWIRPNFVQLDYWGKYTFAMSNLEFPWRYRLGLTISMQKSVLKNMDWVTRYYQKTVKNQPSKPDHQNLTHFGQYVWPRCISFKTEPVDFNTMNPIIWTILFHL